MMNKLSALFFASVVAAMLAACDNTGSTESAMENVSQTVEQVQENIEQVVAQEGESAEPAATETTENMQEVK